MSGRRAMSNWIDKMHFTVDLLFPLALVLLALAALKVVPGGRWRSLTVGPAVVVMLIKAWRTVADAASEVVSRCV